MKTPIKPDESSPAKKGGSRNGGKNISKPKKPGSDPDQTPEKETPSPPVAKPDSQGTQ